MGGFDPFESIREICTRHGVWMHVDGAWGGSCAMSKSHRHLIAGAERADSMTWNPHKVRAYRPCIPFDSIVFIMLKNCAVVLRTFFDQGLYEDLNVETSL